MIPLSSTIKILYDYNRWANRRMLAACQPLTPEQWDRQHGHSFGSVHGMLAHIWAAEALWLERWNGHSPKSVFKAEDFPMWADISRAWSEHEAKLSRFIEGLTDEKLEQPLPYTNTKGEAFTHPLGVLMLHLANHGTHHRGELAAMLAVLDVPHPEDDLIMYYREMNDK